VTLPSDDIRQKIEQAKLLAQLEEHPAWRIIADKIDALVAARRDALCQIGLDADKTAQYRYELAILSWLRKSTRLTTEAQLAKWDQALAFNERMEKMRRDMGLPDDPKELMKT